MGEEQGTGGRGRNPGDSAAVVGSWPGRGSPGGKTGCGASSLELEDEGDDASPARWLPAAGLEHGEESRGDDSADLKARKTGRRVKGSKAQPPRCKQTSPGVSGTAWRL